jgi:hypothetical protein
MAGANAGISSYLPNTSRDTLDTCQRGMIGCDVLQLQNVRRQTIIALLRLRSVVTMRTLAHGTPCISFCGMEPNSRVS